MSDTVQTIIIGAGPSGLSLAYEMKQLGMDPLLLEAGPEAAWSWANMPENLHLLSPWKVNCLPGTRWNLRDMHQLHGCREFQKYCAGYANEHGIRITFDSKIDAVTYNEGFTLTGSFGTLECNNLVNATGYFSKPLIPEYPGMSSSSIRTMHTAAYKSPEQLEQLLGDRAKKILVVGGRISAGQTFEEVHKAGFTVSVSSRHPIYFAHEPWLLKLAFFGFYIYENQKVKTNPQGLESTYPPMEAGDAKKLIKSGEVRVYPDIKQFNETTIEFEDGAEEAFDLVIFATGFHPALAHLESLVTLSPPLHLPETKQMECVEQPGLFLLGYDRLMSFRSRYLRGIREDARTLALALQAKAEARQ